MFRIRRPLCRALTLVLALLFAQLLAVGGQAPAARASTAGSAIVTAARSQAGYKSEPYGSNCNKFSAYWGSGSDCGNGNRSVAWCADFAAWAWAQAGITGVYGNGVNANASSFRTWGQANGRWHPLGDGYAPQPGDAAEYNDAHVGIYTGGSASSPTVINGNWWYPDRGTGQVYEQTNQTSNGDGASLTGYTAAPDGSGAGGLTNGSFINDSGTGKVYRLAGGAPLYVSSWSGFGGSQPTTPVTHEQLLAMPPVPSDGTWLSTTAGKVYRIAGGAPLYVSSWTPFGGPQATTAIDQWDVDNAGNPDAHLRIFPADGTWVSTTAGTVYRIAGGAPLYVSSWAPFGGPQPTTAIDQWDVDNTGNPDAHLRQVPLDGTFITNQADGRVYRVAGGAPLYVSSWDVFGGPQPTTLLDRYEFDNYVHLRPLPSDMFLRGLPSGRIYRVVSGGSRYYVPSWDPYGGTQPYVEADDWALDNCDHMSCLPFGHLDAVTTIVGGARVSGWAMDPDTTAPITVRVTVDGTPISQATANFSRPDVDQVFHRGATFGFSLPVLVGSGSHTVCATALKVGSGAALGILGCLSVSVSGTAVTGSAGISGTTPFLTRSDVTGSSSLGGALTAPPAVARDVARARTLFIGAGTNGRLYVRSGSAPWAVLAGATGCSEPAAAISGNSLLVTCRAASGHLMVGRVTLTNLLPVAATFGDLGGSMMGGPAVGLVGAGWRYFVRGTNGRLYQRGDATTWSLAGAACESRPAAASGGGQSWVSCVAPITHALVLGRWTSAGWSFRTVGGSALGGPGLAATAIGAVTAWVIGSNHALYSQTSSVLWTGSFALFGGNWSAGTQATTLIG